MVRAEEMNTVGNILGAMNETNDGYTYEINTYKSFADNKKY